MTEELDWASTCGGVGLRECLNTENQRRFCCDNPLYRGVLEREDRASEICMKVCMYVSRISFTSGDCGLTKCVGYGRNVPW